jgi:serine phosphatase RsbU (regulator of sigma subunit)
LLRPQPPAAIRPLELRGAKLISAYRDDILRIGEATSQRFDWIREQQVAIIRKFTTLAGAIVILLAVAGCVAYVRERRLAEQRGRLEALQVAYEGERRIATTLQRAFLQQPLPEVDGIELDAVYEPAEKDTQVGGDWYDAILLPDGRLLISIGDVVGHGIDAAIMMNRARQAIAFAAVQEWDPGDVLTRANAGLLLDKATVVTAACGFVDPKQRCAVFASAGHPAPIVVHRTGEPQLIPTSGLPLGIQATSYESHEIRDLDDALIVLLTDGALEYNHDIIEGEAALLEAVKVVKASGSLRPAREIYNRVFEHASAHDDVAILTIGFMERSPAAPNGG